MVALSQTRDARAMRLCRKVIRLQDTDARVPTNVIEPIARAMCKAAGGDPDEPIAEGAYPRWYGMGNEARIALLASLAALELKD